MTHARVDHHHDEEPTRTQVRAPDLCRLTILAQHTQVDLAVPVDVPVALLIPGIVDMITSHSRTNEFDATGERLEPQDWVLARVGQPPLSSTLSLGEHGVKDGELLMLESAEHTAPPPLYDDIMYNVAMVDADRYRRWTPGTARLIGSALAAVATIAGCFGLLWSSAGSDTVLGAACALFAALVFLIAGSIVSRVYGDAPSALVLCGCALPTAFTSGVLFVPGDVAAAHILLGIVMAGATAILALRTSGVGLMLFTGVAVGALFIAPAALVALLTAHPVHAIAAVLAAASLVGLAFAPRMSMVLAKLPLPAVPAPGTSVDPTEDDPSDNQPMPTFDELSAMARRARQYLSGLVAATALVTAGAALAAAEVRGEGVYWQGTALAVICAAVLMFRGRSYAGAEQAVMLIAAGAAILVALLVGAAVTAHRPLAVFGAAMVLAIAALVLGILAPNQTFSPPLRRSVEILEYICVAAVVPLVCWVASLYSLMRGL